MAQGERPSQTAPGRFLPVVFFCRDKRVTKETRVSVSEHGTANGPPLLCWK